jgi:hypothetical protein
MRLPWHDEPMAADKGAELVQSGLASPISSRSPVHVAFQVQRKVAFSQGKSRSAWVLFLYSNWRTAIAAIF